MLGLFHSQFNQKIWLKGRTHWAHTKWLWWSSMGSQHNGMLFTLHGGGVTSRKRSQNVLRGCSLMRESLFTNLTTGQWSRPVPDGCLSNGTIVLKHQKETGQKMTVDFSWPLTLAPCMGQFQRPRYTQGEGTLVTRDCDPLGLGESA